MELNRFSRGQTGAGLPLHLVGTRRLRGARRARQSCGERQSRRLPWLGGCPSEPGLRCLRTNREGSPSGSPPETWAITPRPFPGQRSPWRGTHNAAGAEGPPPRQGGTTAPRLPRAGGAVPPPCALPCPGSALPPPARAWPASPTWTCRRGWTRSPCRACWRPRRTVSPASGESSGAGPELGGPSWGRRAGPGREGSGTRAAAPRAREAQAEPAGWGGHSRTPRDEPSLPSGQAGPRHPPRRCFSRRRSLCRLSPQLSASPVPRAGSGRGGLAGKLLGRLAALSLPA